MDRCRRPRREPAPKSLDPVTDAMTARKELDLIQIHSLGLLRTPSSRLLEIIGQATRTRSVGSVRAPRIAGFR